MRATRSARAERWSAPALVALALFTGQASGQQAGPTFRECVAVEVQGTAAQDFDPPWVPGHPDSIYQQMIARMAREEWYFLADSLYRDLALDTALRAKPAARESLLAQLDSLRREFGAVSSGAEFRRLRATATGVRQQRFAEDERSGRVIFFRGVGVEFAIDDDSWNTAERRAVCGRTIALRRMLSAWGDEGRKAAVAGLQASANRWDNYAQHGYFQYPWELFVNSAAFDPRRDDPPSSQWVLFHPSVGLEFIPDRVKRLTNMQPLETLTLEVGWLRYNGERSSYFGLTAFAAIPSDEVMGLGAMAHVGPAYKVGYVWRKNDNTGNRRDGLLVTTDLAQILAGAPATIERLRTLVRERLEGQKAELLKRVR